MAYTKSFQATIIIYPTFEQDPYCQYLKEQISDWIVDCFNAYTDFFKIKVSQAKGTAVLYTFDVENGDVDLKFKKIWQKSPGSYTIEISGSGIINYGLKNNLEPPSNVSEEILDKIYLKYQETSDIYQPKIIAYGKNPITRHTEVPIQYTFDGCDNEQWENGTKYYDVYADKWKISILTSTSNFYNVLDIIDELKAINKNKLTQIYLDEFEGRIELEGQYILKNEDKSLYLRTLNKLVKFLIEDDFFTIDEINMNFLADSSNTFYFEKYFINESLAEFNVRNIEI